MYKKFKTIEELLHFVQDEANIETLDDDEITLKDWIDLGTTAEKYKKDYGLASGDKRTLQKQKAELTAQIASLTEQLNLVTTELTGLKEIHAGNDKETLQKLNKQLSDMTAKYNASELAKKDLEKYVPEVAELKKEVESYKAASNRSRIVAAVKKAAAARKVPQHIIDDLDFERIVAEDFIIDDTGNIFSKGDTPQSVDNYVAAKQKEKIHWNPTTTVAGNELMKGINEPSAVSHDQQDIAALFG